MSTAGLATAARRGDDIDDAACGKSVMAMRSCIVCRAVRSRDELLALGERAGVVYFGHVQGRRGAWVCVSRSCISKLEERGLARAFRKPVRVAADCSMTETVATIAEQRVYALLGLARRQGSLVVGYDGVNTQNVELVVVAHDASARCFDTVGEHAKVFGSSAELSRCTGLNGVSVLGVAPGSLAHQAAYWLAVWYENRSHGGSDEARD